MDDKSIRCAMSADMKLFVDDDLMTAGAGLELVASDMTLNAGRAPRYIE